MNAQQLIEAAAKPGAIAANILAESMANEVTVGGTVAVVGDPTYPFDGQTGKVKGINGGFADVEFANGIVVPLVISQLVQL